MIMIIDAQNAFHRARTGFKLGPAPIVFNFFRQFKSLVDQFKPERVYFALEGKPVKRKLLDETYKANRIIPAGDPREEEMKIFFEQVSIILEILEHFPVYKFRHPELEADDVIANIVRETPEKQFLVISSDSDFIQLLDEDKNVEIYNPISKKFCEKPIYNYKIWKSLKGDSTDNIVGIFGVGQKISEKLSLSEKERNEFFEKNPDAKLIFEKNLHLVGFEYIDMQNLNEMKISFGDFNPSDIHDIFTKYKFNSIVKPEKWNDWISSFLTLANLTLVN